MLEKWPNDSLIAQAADSEGLGFPAVNSAKLTALCKVRPRIRAYLRCVIRDPDERARAISDVFSEVLSLELDRDIESAAIWPPVLRVLRRIAREEWRWSREVRGDRAVGRLVSDSEAEGRRAYRLALWAWEDAAMGHLTALQRGALELHVMEGLSDCEIAAWLRCPQGSVRVLRATAKRRLRELIDRGVIPTPPGRGAAYPHSGC